jgi:hypothetical protein
MEERKEQKLQERAEFIGRIKLINTNYPSSTSIGGMGDSNV